MSTSNPFKKAHIVGNPADESRPHDLRSLHNSHEEGVIALIERNFSRWYDTGHPDEHPFSTAERERVRDAKHVADLACKLHAVCVDSPPPRMCVKKVQSLMEDLVAALCMFSADPASTERCIARVLQHSTSRVSGIVYTADDA